MKKAFFLDRDGVINNDFGYVGKQENFEFLPGVFRACRSIKSHGYMIVIITNQAGIARGLYSELDFHVLNRYMLQKFSDEGVTIDDVFYCPNHPDASNADYKKDCQRRKPKPGMILDAQHKHGIDLANSVLVGDKTSDIEAGRVAGVGKLYAIHGKYKLDVADDCDVVSSLEQATDCWFKRTD